MTEGDTSKSIVREKVAEELLQRVTGLETTGLSGRNGEGWWKSGKVEDCED